MAKAWTPWKERISCHLGTVLTYKLTACARGSRFLPDYLPSSGPKWAAQVPFGE